MTRFSRLEMDDLPPEARPLAERVMRVSADGLGGPFNLMLRSPAMGGRLMDLLQYFNDETKVLDPVCRRLAVLVLARRAGARYAWWTHSRRALKAGQLSPETIDALNRGQRPQGLSVKQAATVDFVIELTGGGISEPVFARLRVLASEAEIVELMVFCGTYTTVAFLLNEGQVPIPDGEADTLLTLDRPPFTD
jgi:4-carboxymuconolactone decarboxylase